jgi:hypothetical protein
MQGPSLIQRHPSCLPPERGTLSHSRKRARLRQRFPAEKSIFRTEYSLYGTNDGTEMSKIIITSWTSSTVFFLDRIFVTCYFIYVLSMSVISLNTETDWLQDGRLEFLFLTGRSFFVHFHTGSILSLRSSSIPMILFLLQNGRSPPLNCHLPIRLHAVFSREGGGRNYIPLR